MYGCGVPWAGAAFQCCVTVDTLHPRGTRALNPHPWQARIHQVAQRLASRTASEVLESRIGHRIASAVTWMTADCSRSDRRLRAAAHSSAAARSSLKPWKGPVPIWKACRSRHPLNPSHPYRPRIAMVHLTHHACHGHHAVPSPTTVTRLLCATGLSAAVVLAAAHPVDHETPGEAAPRQHSAALRSLVHPDGPTPMDRFRAMTGVDLLMETHREAPSWQHSTAPAPLW